MLYFCTLKHHITMQKLIIFSFLLMFFTACDSETLSVDEQFNRDIQLIEQYLTNNNLEAQKTPEGIYYIIQNPGNSQKPSISNTVTCDYKGYLLNGEVFDQNKDIKFPLSDVITGWQIGIPLFGKGGEGQLFIPSKFGYGTRGSQRIAPNTVLIFDIKLIDFE